MQILLSSNLSLIGKENVTIISLYWPNRKFKIQSTSSKVSIRHETHFLKFFSEQCSNTLKDLFSQLISHIQLLYSYAIYKITCICTYIFVERQKYLMFVRHGFMNFIRIGRCKANVNAGSQFCNFVGSINKLKTILNHFHLKSYVDWFNFTKVRTFDKTYQLPTTYCSYLLVGQDNLISIFVRIYYLVSAYVESTDVVCPTRNSNLPKTPYPDISNGKVDISPDSC